MSRDLWAVPPPRELSHHSLEVPAAEVLHEQSPSAPQRFYLEQSGKKPQHPKIQKVLGFSCPQMSLKAAFPSSLLHVHPLQPQAIQARKSQEDGNWRRVWGVLNCAAGWCQGGCQGVREGESTKTNPQSCFLQPQTQRGARLMQDCPEMQAGSPAELAPCRQLLCRARTNRAGNANPTPSSVSCTGRVIIIKNKSPLLLV